MTIDNERAIGANGNQSMMLNSQRKSTTTTANKETNKKCSLLRRATPETINGRQHQQQQKHQHQQQQQQSADVGQPAAAKRHVPAARTRQAIAGRVLRRLRCADPQATDRHHCRCCCCCCCCSTIKENGPLRCHRRRRSDFGAGQRRRQR